MVISLVSVALTPSVATSFPTLVQLDPDGLSAYSITGISTFDWQASGDLLIEDALVSSSTGDTSLAAFLAAEVEGSTMTFDLHAQARLGEFLDQSLGGMTVLALDTNGTAGGDTGFEITATLDGVESASYSNSTGTWTLTFFDLSGDIQWYLDTTPDSDIETGAGFTDGTEFLTGDLVSVTGTFALGTSWHGSSSFAIDITNVDSTFLEVDPINPGVFLIGSTFVSTIDLFTSFIPRVHVPGVIGDDPYTLLAADIVLKGDASSTFSAVPEPTTILLLGAGLIGLGVFGRRKLRKKS